MKDIREEPDEKEKFEYNEHDESKWHNNCREDIGNTIPEDERKQIADKLGPNWASIMSGLGDQ